MRRKGIRLRQQRVQSCRASARLCCAERKEPELSIILEAPFDAFLDEIEAHGRIDESDLAAFAVEQDLEDDELGALSR
jgi:hypothetical protein